MSEEILNEAEMESENSNGSEIIELPQRVNPYCVISKATFGEYAVRDIQTNSGWSENPYGDTYAVVPDDMVQAILETRGFCDISLNEDGTEVVSFTAMEIPEIPTPEPEPTEEQKRIAELETKLAETEAYQLEQDNMILDNNFEILVLQEGIQDIV